MVNLIRLGEIIKPIEQTYQIKAPIEEVWKALTDPEYIEGWGGGPVEMKDEVGYDFKLWGGEIHGKNIEVIKGEKLVQEWISGDWPKPSIATFVLERDGKETKVTLHQTDVPEDEHEDIDEGWKDYYLGSMKEYLENKK